MNKELQNQAWASLPAAFKREAGKDYIKAWDAKKLDPDNERILAHIQYMEHYFGIDNLPANEVTKYVTEYSGENFVTSKDLNLCSLLKGCEGMEFYSPICGECRLTAISPSNEEAAITVTRADEEWVSLRKDGTYFKDGELMLFPSATQRTWEGWQPPKKRWKPKEDEEYYYIDPNGNAESCCTYDEICYQFGNCFRTQEQAEEAAKRIREVLEKYHEEIGE